MRTVSNGRDDVPLRVLIGNPAVEAMEVQAGHDLLAAPAGYRPAACLGCEVAVYVPEGEPDPLCPACQRLGEILADDDDRPPTPPAGAAALPPEYEYLADYVKRWADDQLVSGISLADRGELSFSGDKAAANAALLSAASAELLRRLDARGKRAAA